VSVTEGRRVRARLGLVAAVYAFVVTMLGTTLPTPLYGLYRERFGFSELMVTVVFATYAGGVIAALLLFGRLSDEIGRRPVLWLGIALSALSAVVFLLAGDIGWLLVGRVISGLSAGVFTGTATATILDLAPAHRRGRATLLATLANIGGLGLGPLLAGVLSEWAGSPLRLSFWVELGLLVVAAAGVLAMPETVAAQGRFHLRPQALAVPVEVRATFLRATLAGFVGFAVLGLFGAVCPAFMATVLKVSNRAAVGAVVFAVFAASTAGQIALERVPRRWALPVGSGVLIAGLGLLAISLGVSSLTLLVLAGVVSGLGQGLSFRSGLAELTAASPAEQRAAVASSFFVVAYVGLSLPVIGVGVLAQLAGLRPAGLVFCAIMAAIAGVVLALVARQGTGA
jgi:predicted MFS family arabinose efflux permease